MTFSKYSYALAYRENTRQGTELMTFHPKHAKDKTSSCIEIEAFSRTVNHMNVCLIGIKLGLFA